MHALAGLLGLFAAVPVAAEITRSPYLQNVTQDGITIMWATAAQTGAGTVYYGSALGTYPDSATSTNAGGIHTARISGLSADQTFYYYVDADGETVGQNDASYYFKTAPPGSTSFRFVAYGDSRSNPPIHGAVSAVIQSYSPDIVVHTGDITRDATMDEYDPQFFEPTAPLIRNTPMFLSIGNHEYSPISNYYDVYDHPTNNPAGTEAYYSFDYGPAHFVCLNTEYLPGGHEDDDPNVAAAQEAWLHADLGANTKPWTFVLFHRPPYGSGGHGDWEPAKALLVPILEQYNVTMVFNGHNHNYDVYRKAGVYYVVTGGGGAGPVPSFENPPHQIYVDPVYPHFHFCVIDVSTDGLEMQAIDQYGTYHTIIAPGHYLWIDERNDLSGTVTVDPDLPAYASGAEVTVTADTGVGMSFRHWEIYDPNHLHDANYIVIDANNSLTIVMNSDQEVVAVYRCSGGAGPEVLLLGIGVLALTFMLRRR